MIHACDKPKHFLPSDIFRTLFRRMGNPNLNHAIQIVVAEKRHSNESEAYYPIANASRL